MFTGIVECLGLITEIKPDGDNVDFTIESEITHELKIDQSVAHNGVCLTVVAIFDRFYVVTAIRETMEKTNLGDSNVGDEINLERCMMMNGRIDGHIVQGHVDQTAICTSVEDQNGSWLFHFEYDPSHGNITVEKGSICVNGVSLTVIESTDAGFSVAIIPYTYEYTTFKRIKKDSTVNLEFDILGKYIAKLNRLNKV